MRRPPLPALAILLTACAALGAVCASPVATASTGTAPDPASFGGAIGEHYRMMGGPEEFLGLPLTPEHPTPDGRGAYVVFEGGSIYFSPSTGAHEVHGAIRDRWGRLGWKGGPLGFPSSIEYRTLPSGGAYSAFEGGSLHWSPATGAHLVRGAIRDAWGATGWEAGPLGFPVSDEYDVPGGKRSDFQHGRVTWTPGGGARVSAPSPLAGCGTRTAGATPDQAAHCLVRAWDAGRADLVRAWSTDEVTRVLLDPVHRSLLDGILGQAGCTTGRVPGAQPRTSTGVVCLVDHSHPVTAVAEEGAWLALGTGRDERGAFVEDVAFSG
ncbi:LGFP repeat-containing protein [Kineococcus sp. NUM-3379]